MTNNTLAYYVAELIASVGAEPKGFRPGYYPAINLNGRPARKGLLGGNTLAYFISSLVTKKKVLKH